MEFNSIYEMSNIEYMLCVILVLAIIQEGYLLYKGFKYISDFKDVANKNKVLDSEMDLFNTETKKYLKACRNSLIISLLAFTIIASFNMQSFICLFSSLVLAISSLVRFIVLNQYNKAVVKKITAKKKD